MDGSDNQKRHERVAKEVGLSRETNVDAQDAVIWKKKKRKETWY